MDSGSLLLALALLLVVAAFVARPILDRVREREHAPGTADVLLAERESVLTALGDLDFDHATGKTVDEDYQPQRAALVGQGVEILRQLDALGVNGHDADDVEMQVEAAIAARRSRSDPRGKGDSRGRSDADIERAVAATRGKIAAITCHNCGAPAHADDKFCSKCGTALDLTCSNCGQAHVAGDKFCGKCGAALAAPAEV
ncbi:MAG: zinc ribbon domain-containing protein [Chloroflexi bacterium]|nr:zinc ribbon domain-containing protein [Chloroflexota bacterium]